MKESSRPPIQSAGDSDTLSAMWISSLHDEISEMTYEGIKRRLGLEAREEKSKS